MFGGRCDGLRWVRRYWQREPHGESCRDCQCYNAGECEVSDGIEAPKYAECLMEHIRLEEITDPWARHK